MLSDAQARAQLEAVLDDARSSVRRLLSRNRHLVEALRDALLERHELLGDEITDVLLAAHLTGGDLPPVPQLEESSSSERVRVAASVGTSASGGPRGSVVN